MSSYDEISYNPFSENVFLQIMGIAILSKKSKLHRYLNLIYVSIVSITTGFLSVQSIQTLIYLPIPDTSTAIRVLHFFVLTLSALSMYYISLHWEGTNRRGSNMIADGLIDRRIDEKEYAIIKTRVRQVRTFSNWMLFCCVLGPISVITLVPVGSYFFRKESKMDDFLNPFLPFPVHMPFDTKTVLGYVTVLSMQGLFLLTVYLEVLFIAKSYVSFCLQLSGQFEVLNYSLTNIHKKAEIYKRIFETSEYLQQKSSMQKEMNYIMFQLLRENIIHHQAILRLMRLIRPYLEIINLISLSVFTLFSSVPLLIILKDSKGQIGLVFMSAVIVLGFMVFCTVGELLITKSGDLHRSIYSTPWYGHNPGVAQAVSIMMTFSRYPVVIRSFGLNLDSSLATYGDMISAGYKFLNLMWKMI